MVDILLRLRNIIEIVDIIAVAVVIYWIMVMFKNTKAERMLWGLGIIVVVYFVTDRMEFLTLHWLLSNFLGSIVVFVIVVFQQDIRRALTHMGKHIISGEVKAERESLSEIVKAVGRLKGSKTGALIVLERGIDLTDHLESGIVMDSSVSMEVLLSIFNTASPLHDGAVIVRRGRIHKAGCILPLTEKAGGATSLDGKGTRHRAAIGLAEDTDAVVVVVSEETGDVALMVEEKAFSGIGSEELLDALNGYFAKGETPRSQIFPWRISS